MTKAKKRKPPGRGGDRRSGKQFPPNAVKYHLFCAFCKAPFDAARPDALYDQPKCRSAAARRDKALPRSLRLAQERLRQKTAKGKNPSSPGKSAAKRGK